MIKKMHIFGLYINYNIYRLQVSLETVQVSL